VYQGQLTTQEQGIATKVQTQIPSTKKIKASYNQQKTIEIIRTSQTTGHKRGKAAYKYIPARKSDRATFKFHQTIQNNLRQHNQSDRGATC
jgi:hypothetical protein